jgi:mannose/fructose/N-acetylgalactosamine-specific phosphotransferase system component IIB
LTITMNRIVFRLLHEHVERAWPKSTRASSA